MSGFNSSYISIQNNQWQAIDVVMSIQQHINHLMPILDATQNPEAKESAIKIKTALTDFLSSSAGTAQKHVLDYSMIDEDLTRLRSIYIHQKERSTKVAQVLHEMENDNAEIKYAARVLAANVITFNFHLEFVDALQSHIREYFGRGRSR